MIVEDVKLDKPVLKIDWATHEAAKYACENWHYSKCMPVGKLVKIGAWENRKFIGVVLFGRGATPNLGKAYGLEQTQSCELVRIALTEHKSPVSKIMALAIKWFKKQNTNMRLIISFADKTQGHHGGIYQATNWVYTGNGDGAYFYNINGKLTHPRSIGAKGFSQNIEGAKKIDKNAEKIYIEGKHRYLMPLDAEMRKQIEPLAKPYPKRASSADSGTSDNQSQGGGAIPTDALQNYGTIAQEKL